MSDTAIERRLQKALDQRRAEGTLRTIATRKRDETALNFADNDYLGLANNAELTALCEAQSHNWPLSASASPLVGGHMACHASFECTLMEDYGCAAALLCNGGYTANAGLLGSLIGKEDRVFCDRLIHRSMIEGMRKSQAKFVRFDHNDLDHLERLLQRHPCEDGQVRWVLTESLYSMDGDSPDLKRLARLHEQYKFLWVLDEAHAIGWYGPRGRGLAAQHGVLSHVDMLVGTLGKALASFGAFVLFQSERWRTYIANFCPEFIYATYLPPRVAVQSHCAWRWMGDFHEAHADDWHAHARAFRKALRADGWDVPDGDSPIVPVMAMSPARLETLRQALEKSGIFCGAIRPPTVPPHGARLRLSLKATFNAAQYERVRAALKPFSPHA